MEKRNERKVNEKAATLMRVPSIVRDWSYFFSTEQFDRDRWNARSSNKYRESIFDDAS